VEGLPRPAAAWVLSKPKGSMRGGVGRGAGCGRGDGRGGRAVLRVEEACAAVGKATSEADGAGGASYAARLIEALYCHYFHLLWLMSIH
jgi:uncharacterized protein (DUF983 family)